MLKKAKEFTQQEKEVFLEHFYYNWDEDKWGEEDLDSPYPWGCPWLHSEDEMFDTSDMRNSADNYFYELYDDIETNVSSCPCGHVCDNCV